MYISILCLFQNIHKLKIDRFIYTESMLFIYEFQILNDFFRQFLPT